MLTAILLIFFLLIGGFVAFLFSGFGENFLKTKIEQIGSQHLPSDVKIEGIQLDLFKQLVSIQGLVVSHPRGEKYTTPHMLRISSLTVQADLTKLFSNEVHVLEASVVSSDVFFEGGLIQNNLKTFLSKLGGEKKEESRDFNFEEAVAQPKSEPKPKSEPSAFDYVVEKFEFKDSGISFRLTGVPDFVAEKIQGFRLSAPDYVTSIGGKSEKATKELCENYISHVLGSIVNYLEGLVESLPNAIEEEVLGTIGSAPEIIGDFLRGEEEGKGPVGVISDLIGEKENDKEETKEDGGFLDNLIENEEVQDMAVGAAANLASGFFS